MRKGPAVPTLLEITTHLFLQMLVILVTYRLIWPILRKLAQVQVVAIMVAGFLLGPSVLGLIWPTGQRWLFPTTLHIGGTSITHPNLVAIYVVGQLGLVLYMFLVGASFKLDILGAHRRQAGVTSAFGVVVPLILGSLLGWTMVTKHGQYFTDKVGHWQGALFIASAVAITAFPMLAWIVYDSGLMNTRLGTMSLSCAAVDDACSWMLLAAVVASTRGSMNGALIAVAGGVGYLLFMVFIVRRWLARLNTWSPRGDNALTGGIPITHLTIVLLVILAGCWFTDYVGIFSVFGAFVAGTVMPRGEFLDTIRARFEPLVAYLLLPAFFIYSGLNTQLSLILKPSVLLIGAAILVVSFAGKFGAVGLAARWQGMGWREAGSMGALANARGLMELILLNIGQSAGLITNELYTILALMTIITTLLATPIQRMFERHAWKEGYVFGRTGEEPKPVRATTPATDVP